MSDDDVKSIIHQNEFKFNMFASDKKRSVRGEKGTDLETKNLAANFF